MPTATKIKPVKSNVTKGRPRPKAVRSSANPARKLLGIAREKAVRCETWTELSNAIYGIGGPFSQLFPTTASRTSFAKTPEYRAVSDLIDRLPGPGDERQPAVTSSGKLLVRLPASIHAALIKEADLEGVSVNQLVVAKLSAQLRTMTMSDRPAAIGKKQKA